MNMSLNTTPRWWQDTVFYEIYIASFQDGNNDGIGDFKGLTSRLDYLQKLGINGLWITPFYPSPKVDNGYDVANYLDVDPDFGSLNDFDEFITQAHQRNIKVIIDVVLNHVSTEHNWFKQATCNPESKYRDYFFFQNKTNGWHSFFGGPAWQKEPSGEQFYYHKFAPQQADLNWKNEAVMGEMLAVLKFWLDRGADGFRFDVINFLCCDGIGKENQQTDPDGKQVHRWDIDQPGIKDCIAKICKYVRDYSYSINKHCFLVGEVGHEQLTQLLPYQSDKLLDVVFNFNFGSVKKFDIKHIYQQLVAMEEQQQGLPTLFFNSHDMARSFSRLCNENIDHAAALAALMLMSKGVCFIYFGEEIGMSDYIPGHLDEMRDIQAINHYRLAVSEGLSEECAYSNALDKCRDKSRLYMQWDDSEFSGFSQVRPWIGERKTTEWVNLKQQLDDPDSLWSWYQTLIQLRKKYLPLSLGDYHSMSLNENVLSISRCWKNELIHIQINFSQINQPINYNSLQKVLVSRGLNECHSASLPPYGVLISREVLNVN